MQRVLLERVGKWTVVAKEQLDGALHQPHMIGLQEEGKLLFGQRICVSERFNLRRQIDHFLGRGGRRMFELHDRDSYDLDPARLLSTT
jgi:hypothetical protein